eukprot:1217522-Rhodomonas_salina.2
MHQHRQIKANRPRPQYKTPHTRAQSPLTSHLPAAPPSLSPAPAASPAPSSLSLAPSPPRPPSRDLLPRPHVSQSAEKGAGVPSGTLHSVALGSSP